MNLKPFECGIGIGLMTLCSCIAHKATAPRSPHQITQVSVINALAVGRYDGVMPIPELLRHGDFGLGTLDHLDGELVALDGRPYQVRGDGAVVEVPPDRSTPFAVVTRFDPDGTFPCPPAADLAGLGARMDEALPQRNQFVAIRVDGRFASLTLRSVGRQEPPYRSLVAVAEGQSVWTREDQVGTLVGIRFPAWVGGLNVPGYHWHFLSDDRKVGGHVLNCRIGSARVRYQVCQDWVIKLDQSDGFNLAELGRDHSREIRRVETASGCRPADVPAEPQRDLATLDRLLRLMERRMALMHEVARWKWSAGQPITDAQRERELLQSVVERGRGKGLNPELVRSFFAAQMEAARLVQQADFERWKADRQGPFADAASLAVLRQRIDLLNRELIDALAELRPWLPGQSVQRALPRRAEGILTGNGVAGVRETAIAPLRR